MSNLEEHGPKNLNDPQYISKQYRDAANLTARISLHQRFGTNPYNWQPWVFDHFDLPSQCRVLELGCGTGNLWLENLERIPPGWQITLSDQSKGMVEQARSSLDGQRPFQFEVIDAQSASFPLESGNFDAVIANHMLYHLADRPTAFSEIRRVLKPGGRILISDLISDHPTPDFLIQNMDALVGCLPVQKDEYVGQLLAAGLEEVAVVEEKPYPNEMMVTDPAVQEFLRHNPEEEERVLAFVGSIRSGMIQGTKALE